MEGSREKILRALSRSQVTVKPAAVISRPGQFDDPVSKFIEVFGAIGGIPYRVSSTAEVAGILEKDLVDMHRVVSTLSEFSAMAQTGRLYDNPADLQDVDLFIARAHLGVAENGAVWIPESEMGDRVLPFICRHFAVIIDHKNILSNMHDAYQRIGGSDYGFSAFIAGPSRTADIEQSLVLGAHGPVSMRVFIV